MQGCTGAGVRGAEGVGWKLYDKYNYLQAWGRRAIVVSKNICTILGEFIGFVCDYAVTVMISESISNIKILLLFQYLLNFLILINTFKIYLKFD